MALGAVIDEHRLEGRLYAGDDSLVDVALALLFSGGLDIQVDELLAIDDRDPQLFGLGRIEQHAFHFLLSPALDVTEEDPVRRDPGDELLQKSIL